MKKSLTLAFFIFLSWSLAQGQASAGYLRMGGLGQVIQPKSRKAGYAGNIYMDTSWRKANILLYNSDQVIPNLPVKYELKSNELEIRADGEVKIIDASKVVKSMVWFDFLDQPHEFINGRDFTLNGTSFRGLLEVVYQGKISIYKQYSYYILPSNRNEALSTGTVDEQPRNENFILYSTGTDLQKLPKRKKMLELFGDKMQVMAAYIKENDLNASNQAHLAKIFEHYNSL